MKDLKELLAKECDNRFSMDTTIMEKFFDQLTEVRLRRGEILCLSGQMDTNMYVIRRGIVRLSYFDGLNERTFAFGAPGSLLTQLHCYYLRMPAFFQCDACTESVVMKISKQRFDALLDESEEFARWFLDRVLDQLCGLELRLDRLNGTAGERYAVMVKKMPEMAGSIPARMIASYMGITPSYLSQLKKRHPVNIVKNKEELDPVASHILKLPE